MKEAGTDIIRKANLINEIADTIANIGDAVKRSVYVQAVSERFDIEQSILFSRISATRRKMLTDEKKEQQREERRKAAALPPLPDEYPGEYVPEMPPTQITMDALEENKLVAPAEKELLTFLLQYGHDTLDFPSDSKYYSGSEEDKATVAEFIDASLSEDGGCLINPAYDKVYQAYLENYFEGHSQDDILRTLLGSSDPVIPFVVSQLTLERYQITVQDFSDSLMTRASWLVKFVPQTILTYMDRKIETRITDLRGRLSGADSLSVNNILTEILKLQAAQKEVKKEMQ